MRKLFGLFAAGIVALGVCACNGQTTPATNIGTAQAQLNSNVGYEPTGKDSDGDDGGADTDGDNAACANNCSFWMRYKKDSDSTWTDVASSETTNTGPSTSGQPSYTVTGLSPGTLYDYQVCGADNVGGSKWTSIGGSDTTTADADDSAPQDSQTSEPDGSDGDPAFCAGPQGATNAQAPGATQTSNNYSTFTTYAAPTVSTVTSTPVDGTDENVSATVTNATGADVNPCTGTGASSTFDYGTTTSYGSTTTASTCTETSGVWTVSGELTGLTAGTGYHVRLQVVEP